MDLFEFVKKGEIEIVQELMKNGSDPNLKDQGI